MKSHANLWPRITSFENLSESFRRARRGKRARADVAAFEHDLERNLLGLQQELRDGRYRPGPYRNFVVHEPTERKISAAPFRDRVVHHALCGVIEPLFDRVFFPHSFADRVGKGTHRALDRAQALVRRYRFVLKADVPKFFPSIDHEILYGVIAKSSATPRATCTRRDDVSSSSFRRSGSRCIRRRHGCCPSSRVCRFSGSCCGRGEHA